MDLVEKALKKPEFGLRIRSENSHQYSTIVVTRPTKNYHILLENELKPASPTTMLNIRKEIRDYTENIPENKNLTFQGLNRMEFLYYCLYTHIEGSSNGIEVGVLPTLIQDVEFKDYQGRPRAFLSGEVNLNSLDFKLADPSNMHERHTPLAKIPYSLP